MSKIYEAIKRAEREREQSRDTTATRRSGALPIGLPQTEPLVVDRADEDYQRLRANLVGTTGFAGLHRILVTAGRHGEGTTRTALGLAIALTAEKEANVLLMEVNLRSPSLAGVMNIRNHPGVAEFLAGQAAAESLPIKVEESKISVIHAGSTPAAVDCEAIGDLVDQVSAQYDFTILDAPPVNRYPDASVLGLRSDGVLLVVEADRTPVVDAETARRNLDRAGARILGVVLNRRRSYIPAVLQGLF